jgi:hypothetical protein
MSFGWWNVLETHRKTVEHEKSSSVAVLDKPVRLAPSTIHRSKALQYFILPIHPLNGTHTQTMSQLSQGVKNHYLICLLLFIYTY